MRRISRMVGLGLLLWSLGPTAVSDAVVFYTKKEALAAAFPGADEVEARRFFLEEAQVKEIQRQAKAKLETDLITLHVGIKDGREMGFAYIDSHQVRTMPEALLIVISPEGKVQNTLLLTFYEPPEYAPSDQWLAQFLGEPLSDELRVRRKIQGMAGATLTVNGATNAVRRVLAMWQVLVRDQEK